MYERLLYVVDKISLTALRSRCPERFLWGLQKRPVSQSSIFNPWATRRVAQKLSLPIDAFPLCLQHLHNQDSLFPPLGYLDPASAQDPGFPWRVGDKGLAKVFPFQKDALLVPRGGQLLLVWCILKSRRFHRDTTKQWGWSRVGGRRGSYSHPSLCQ